MLKELKEIADDMLDKELRVKALPSGRIGTLGLSNERLKVLENVLYIAMYTDIISDIARQYLCTKGATPKMIRDNYVKSGIDIDVKKIYNEIFFNSRRLEKVFGVSFLSDIKNAKKSINIEEANEKVLAIMARFNKNDELNVMKLVGIKVPTDYAVNEISDSEFECLVGILKKFSSKSINEIIRSNKNLFGYLNYLVASPKHNDLDNQRISVIKKELE